MRAGQWEDFVQFDPEGRIIRPQTDSTSLHIDGAISTDAPVTTLDDEPDFGPVPVGGFVTGAVDTAGDTDFYTVSLVAGQTYTFSLQGAGANPITDSLLVLYGPSGSGITYDDDGGNHLYSIITYTATQTGTYYLRASSFANPGDPGLGSYVLDVRQMGTDTVGSTNATAGSLDVGGYVVGFRETGTDVDRYAVTLEAGQLYSFAVAGGADYETNYLNVPTGTLDTILVLRDAAGNILASNDDNNFPSDISSGVSFYAEQGGTYYLDVIAYPGQTGGYVLESTPPIDPSTLDPLEAIRWDSASNIPTVLVDGVPTAYVYFAPASDGGFGETERTDDFPPGTPITTYGWEQYQIDAVMHALRTAYTPITGINYVVTTDVNQATFRLVTTINDDYGARFYPQQPSSGSLQGLGIFNLASGGFGSDPASLQPGGFSYAVVLHEFGHAHGLAHPHDNGGGSEVLVGVTGADSLGIFDLNQGVYTVMSYNDGWITHPDGTRTYSAATRGSGWSETLSAFDIAALQERYGTHDLNTGNTVYTLADNQADASYQTIWDTGGTDTISYVGTRDAQIDLLAATLDYSATGGGVVSFAHGVFGGYTIAHGVLIENASGGAGNDVLLGNSADNTLSGNDGNDSLFGREGNDTLNGGNGDDAVDGGAGADALNGGNGIDTLNGGAGNDSLDGGNGDDVLGGGAGDDNLIGGNGNDRLNGGAGNDTINGGRGADLFVFTDAGTDTIVGYERGEDLDFSGLGVTAADVTIQANRIIVELGENDLIINGTRGVTMADLIFASESQSASFSSLHQLNVEYPLL